MPGGDVSVRSVLSLLGSVRETLTAYHGDF